MAYNYTPPPGRETKPPVDRSKARARKKEQEWRTKMKKPSSKKKPLPPAGKKVHEEKDRWSNRFKTVKKFLDIFGN